MLERRCCLYAAFIYYSFNSPLHTAYNQDVLLPFTVPMYTWSSYCVFFFFSLFSDLFSTHLYIVLTSLGLLCWCQKKVQCRAGVLTVGRRVRRCLLSAMWEEEVDVPWKFEMKELPRVLILRFSNFVSWRFCHFVWESGQKNNPLPMIFLCSEWVKAACLPPFLLFFIS